MKSLLLNLLILLLPCLHIMCAADEDDTSADSYDSIKELQESIFSSASYSTTLRPVKKQSDTLFVSATFSLVSVVSLDNVKQELVTNGFLFLVWKDQRIRWNPGIYGGVSSLAPTPYEIWKPRLMLINTLGKRDPFGDDYSYTVTNYDGIMNWAPGGIITTQCALNMEKFPFDVQKCQIQMCPMSHVTGRIDFTAQEEVNLGFYIPNPGWDLVTSKVIIESVIVSDDLIFSCPTINFELKRRPMTIVLNVIVPVIFMSILNNLVFLIPVDSGEKISYAITVLLALTVFLSMVSTMTPQVSDVIPALTIYLFVLLLSSVLTVAASIFSVYLHNLDKREETSIRSKSNFQTAVRKIVAVNRAVAPLDAEKDRPREKKQDSLHDTTNSPGHNSYRGVSKHINTVLFLLINGLSLVMTVWYFTFTLDLM